MTSFAWMPESNRQRRPKFPVGCRQLHRSGNLHIIRTRALRIEHDLIPIQIENIRGCRGSSRAGAAVVGNGIERNLQLVRACRHVDVEGIHIHGIALPRQRLACGFHLYAHDIGNGAGRAMIAGNPFRINQRERTWLNRNRQPRVIDIARRVAQIDGELN